VVRTAVGVKGWWKNGVLQSQERRGVWWIYNNNPDLRLKSPKCPWCLYCVKKSVFSYHFSSFILHGF